MSNSELIPFLDLVTPHVELEEELVAVFRKALRSAAFIGGSVVEDFEAAFAEFCGSKYCVGVGNGTDALRFAIMAAGVGLGEIVITVPNTFIATAEAISQAGALIRFVDIDERTYNMDPEKLREFLDTNCVVNGSGVLVERKSGLRVSAVIPVHLYGQMADMDRILDIASAYRLTVIEDACQAHGAEYFSSKSGRWHRAGTMGKVAAFSFYPGKNLGACGEAGAVTTDDETIARNIRMIRDHGQAKKYYHDIEGYNGRLDAIQAAFLTIKLKHLPQWTQQRQQLADEYNRAFAASGASVVTPFQPEWSRSVYHLYVLRVPDREALRAELAKQGIGTGIHYPVPLHQQKAYLNFGYRTGQFPVTEAVAGEILSIPMFPTLSSELQRQVVDRIREFCNQVCAAAV